MVGRLRTRLILSLILGVLVFTVSFLTLPVYSFTQTKTMDGLRIDTDKERYALSENVTFNVFILNESNSSLFFAVQLVVLTWKAPSGSAGRLVHILETSGSFSTAPQGEYFYGKFNWPVGPDGKKIFPGGYALPGVYAIEVSLDYLVPDNTVVHTNATSTILFTLL